MKSLGLDIGTTSISLVVIDENDSVVESFTVPNDTAITGEQSFDKMQDAVKILNICEDLLDHVTGRYTDIASIGLTGQMHGIVYVDNNGNAVSPLYTWQNKSGNELLNDTVSYSEFIHLETGYEVPAGYGLATHFYLTKVNKVPETASTFATIADYIGMALAKLQAPILHPSMAASLGLYDLEKNQFDRVAIRKIGLNLERLPVVSTDEQIIGYYNNIPVAPALGDNQASFRGAIGKEGRVLVNVGTGSQVSIYSESFANIEGLECRPYINGSYLLVGSSLCGGYAYNLLYDFIAGIADMLGVHEKSDIYERMNLAASEGLSQTSYKDSHAPIVDTRFNGTRKDPSIRGSVTNISGERFTPEVLSAAVLRGICEELYQFALLAPEQLEKTKFLVGSGNGLRKNEVLQKIFAERFERPVQISENKEEAASGAALFSKNIGHLE
jgi:sedoheptulokinase